MLISKCSTSTYKPANQGARETRRQGDREPGRQSLTSGIVSMNSSASYCSRRPSPSCGSGHGTPQALEVAVPVEEGLCSWSGIETLCTMAVTCQSAFRIHQRNGTQKIILFRGPTSRTSSLPKSQPLTRMMAWSPASSRTTRPHTIGPWLLRRCLETAQ